MSKMTPQQIAKTGSEHAHQTAFFCWAAGGDESDLPTKWPFLRWCLFAIPNGGERNLKVASNLKAEGVKAGVSDIFLAVARGGWHGLFIEMKVKPNKPTIEQLTFHTEVSAQTYKTAVCYSWEEARDVLKAYLAMRP